MQQKDIRNLIDELGVVDFYRLASHLSQKIEVAKNNLSSCW